jgi:hydrogenase nickel incorporation protein HypB
MCTVCGCGDPGKGASFPDDHTHDHAHGHDHVHDDHDHPHDHGDGHVHAHAHGHGHDHDHDHLRDHAHPHTHGHAHEHGVGEETADLHFGLGLAGAHVPGLSQGRIIQIEQDILGHNNALADSNRAWFAERGVFALNLVSSPGSGKTTLLCRTVEALAGRLPLAVIEGDQQTTFDADRIRATGAPALQVNTGKGCHLDAQMIASAIKRLEPAEDSVLFIENVGNLVCPAAFDLGEAYKVAILSVTEGEDKPLKYPDMFHAAGLMVLNKTDLLPHVDFDVERCLAYAREVNPDIVVLQVSARTGEGFEEWLAWVVEGRRRAMAQRARLLEQKLTQLRSRLDENAV